ncbi:MAG: carbonic anhydrase family protein [Azoarcus sp.]|jgi:carbonic anhydrase|nr:carbonic anhydrase family protein [Azoarcus sp.]
MLVLPRIVFLLVVMAATAAAQAAGWERIVDDNKLTVEIDADGTFTSDHGTKVSWGRVVLGNAEAVKTGYRTIKALNRYDCLNRSFSTIKRVYLDNDDNVIREETITDQTPMLVRRNSVDERILRKACGLSNPVPSVKNGKANAAETAKSDTTNRLDKLAAAADRAAKSVNAAPATAAGLPSPHVHGIPPKSAPLKTMPLPVAAAPVNAAPEKSAVLEAPAKSASRQPVSVRFTPTPAAAPMPRQSGTAPMAATVAAKVPAAQNIVGFHPVRGRAAPVIHSPPRPARHATPMRTAAVRPASSGESWRYYGAGGPESWGRLRPEWRLCGEGLRQSPIDFAASAPIAVDLDPVRFDYRPSRFLITNTEQQLRVKVDAGMSMEVRGQRYMLEGFVLHRPGEARIAGKVADMEVQFFHRDAEGRIAVLAVQAARGDTPNALLQALLNNLPLEKGDSYAPETLIDLAAFLPANPAHFLYMGSLTAPPCTEGVLWVVMKEPVMLSDEQFGIFSRLHPGNARPPQPANARLVLESR